MRQRGQTTTFEIRLEIGEHAAAGLNDSQIAAVVGCSVWTVHKWRRRSQYQGRIGLTSHMGGPATGPGSTFPGEVTERLLSLRKLHPGWGPETLLTALQALPSYQLALPFSLEAWRQLEYTRLLTGTTL